MVDQAAAPPPKRKKKKRKKKKAPHPGRQAWVPTKEQVGEIKAAARLGQPQQEIAEEIGVDTKTLMKHCEKIIRFGKRQFLRRVHASLGDQALGRPAVYDDEGRVLREELKPVPTPGIFLLKTQGKEYGFIERAEVTGKDGMPLIPEEKLKSLTNEQLAVLEEARTILAGLVGAPGT